MQLDALHTLLLLLLALALIGLFTLVRERYRLKAQGELLQARLEDANSMQTGFEAVASRVLRQSNAEFLQLAKESLSAKESRALAQMDERRTALDRLIEPIQAAVEKTHLELRRVERDHVGLHEQVTQMTRSNQRLRLETSRLVQALRKPNVRGRYGEVQLERVVELAGMRSYCDFTTQENLRDAEGRLQKPDLVVRLPNGRIVAVDAKTSIDGYMDALEAKSTKAREDLLERYAQNVLEQVQKLSKKGYWKHFEESPELVVMFIPGDQLVDAALERRTNLIELAAERNVVIASPSTLIGLLRAVHVGWREKNLSESAEELFELGRELHKRAGVVLERAAKVGESLDGARRHYNSFVGSVQSRLVPALRKFEERDARSARDVVELEPIEGETRELPGPATLFDGMNSTLSGGPPAEDDRAPRAGRRRRGYLRK